MKSVQISFDEKPLKTIDRYAKSSQLSRSEAVHEAVRSWIRQKQIDEFENTWISKLKENPQDVSSSAIWLKTAARGDK